MKSFKRILVPTDFSETANNALIYAIDFARQAGAELLLLHAYQLPVPPSYHYPVGYYEAVKPEEFKKAADKRMKILQQDFLYAPKVPFECITRLGAATNSIESIATERNVDLLIMGSRKAAGAKAWFGSVTTHTVKHSMAPVLVIPQEVRFNPPQKLVLATDLLPIQHLKVLDTLKVMARLFKASIEVLHIHPEKEEYTRQQTKFRETLSTYLGDATDIIHLRHEHVNEGIQQFLDKNQADMLVMLSQQHGLLNQLMHSSKTKYMIFHTHKPLLVLK
ncbi:universal stress protein [Catalinimonas alkaloidigena]|uniref:universal stress protein n=1 Tax=Catalinimonas alkaloidigena TaxID=1075417 RepID=UPI00240658C4|nr:universal stress protein [Catalinimonas alkaloidigena]